MSVIGILFPKVGCRSRGLWRLAELSLGGEVRMVAAHGTNHPSIARYFFKLVEPE